MKEHLKHHQIAIGKLMMGFVYNIGMRVRTTLHQNHQLFAKEQSTENLVLVTQDKDSESIGGGHQKFSKR